MTTFIKLWVSCVSQVHPGVILWCGVPKTILLKESTLSIYLNLSIYLADYLDLTFIIDSGGKLSTRLHDKHENFDFHIVNFPYLSSNIPSGLLMVCTVHSSLDMHDALTL